MEKEGHSDFFNSRNGKVNVVLLFSVVIVFLFSLLIAEAAWDANQLIVRTPSNFSFNGTNNVPRNINFTFNITWIGGANQSQNVSNCSLWINSTQAAIAWSTVKNVSNLNNQPDDRVFNYTSAAGTLSYMNYTFNADGNYTFAIGCYEHNASGAGLNFTANHTFFLDTNAPTLTIDTPKGNFIDATEHNVTSYATATIYVNVTDNSTNNVFLILNSRAGINSDGSVDTLGTNETINRTMTGGAVIAAPDKRQFYFNLSGIFNFNSSFTSPGTHSLFFCANDSLRRQTCSNRLDFIIKGMNITQMENMFAAMQQFDGAGNPLGSAFGGLNITLGNGTEIPTDTFMNPITGVTVGGLTHKNFTFIFNFTSDIIVHIVAGSVDESQFANASRSKVNNTPSREIQQQVGTGYTAQMAWADIASFIPSEVSYQYGILQLAGVGYSKKMYCNGTNVANPNCHSISQCNATVFGIYNATPGQTTSSTGVIPTSDACWLESGTINDQALRSGFTYIFVDHFSGGLGGSDFSQINVTYNGPLSNNFNTTTALNTINFTLEDINSTGLNLTANNSINVTLTLGGSVAAFFNFTNLTDTRLSCTTSDILSWQNTTSVTCNVTYAFSNGTYLINVTARDTSNNSNPTNVSTSSITVTIDQIPPIFVYYNFTNSSTFNTSGPAGFNAVQLAVGNNASRAQGGGVSGTIYGIANWTDNLTDARYGMLQFYNTSTPGWQTINTTGVNGTDGSYRNGGWTNFSFPIPQGHNNFEGANISFRIIANDTLGNLNNLASVKNFTIQINDTTVPTLLVTVNTHVNQTNTSSTTPTIVWNVTESTKLKYIAVQIDGSIDSGCNKFTNYTGSVEGKRNSSITVSSDAGCPLADGARAVRLTAEDVWGNSELYLFQINVQTATPTITLSSIQNHTSAAFPAGLIAVNNSNITPYTAINFTAVDGTTGVMRDFSWTSSCNSAGEVLSSSATNFPTANNSYIWPFNFSGCKGIEANATITVTVADTAGNSVANLFKFAVDDLGPSIGVSSPTNNSRFAGLVDVNVSAFDGVSRIDTIGYYIDGDNARIYNHTINGSVLTGAQGQNTSIINRTINFTAGTHTIQIRVNDTLGNVMNSSIITFTTTGPIPPANTINTSIRTYLIQTNPTITFNSTLRLKDSSGNYNDLGSNTTESDQTYEILLNVNATINVTLTEINGSGANWNKINFSVLINESRVQSQLQNNWSNNIRNLVYFNSSISQFLPNPNGYYGIVVLPMNVSGGLEIWWFPDETNLGSRTNVSQCTAAFTPTTTTPCFNFTSGGKTIVQVPHFSIVLVSNDSSAPTVTVTQPDGNQSVSMFVPNITVSNDAILCEYSINGTGPKQTMTKSGNVCLGQTEGLKNLNAVDGSYNFTFNVTDSSGNVNAYILKFNVSDNTAPNNGEISSSVSTTTATVAITSANESVNATVKYDSTNTTMSSVAMETDFNVTQSVSITGLTASTKYYFNVSVCDFNGNCKTNGTFTFTTSAAATTTTTTTSSSSGGGSAGAVTTPTVATVASAGRQWDSLEAGTSGVLAINKEDIAVTGVTIDVKNTVSNPSITIGSLASNPQSAPAAAKVYQYLQLTKGNIADSDASKITVNFRVPKSWLSTNGVAETDIILWRYSNGWAQLATKLVSSDGSYANYEAVTPGFSTFAVGNKEAGTSAFAIIDMIRDFYAGTSKLTAFDIIDQIRSFYGG